MDSDDTLLGFLRPPGAGLGGVPLQQLFGFDRVHLKAGESRLVGLYPELHEFSQVGDHRALEVESIAALHRRPFPVHHICEGIWPLSFWSDAPTKPC